MEYYIVLCKLFQYSFLNFWVPASYLSVSVDGRVSKMLCTPLCLLFFHSLLGVRFENIEKEILSRGI